jgi:RNA polymerase sigma-70 factor (ECF subfamily)
MVPRAMQLCRDRSDALDLVQDAIERALRFEHRFDPSTQVEAWLRHPLLMVFLTRRKRQQREWKVQQWFSERPEDALGLGVSLGFDFSGPVRRAIEGLREPFRTTLLLVHVEGLTCNEAAQELNVAMGTILSRLHRAREMLRESLRGSLGDD